MFGVDLSFHKGKPKWDYINDLDFAILAVTRQYNIEDESFNYNFKGCKKKGIKIGLYKYSYAMSSYESKQEAKTLLKILKNRKIDLPIFLDLEYEMQKALTKSKLMAIIRAFEKQIVKAGYEFGIYCDLHWYNNYIPEEAKEKYPFWIASVPYEEDDDGSIQYRLKPFIESKLVCWQYSHNGRLPLQGNESIDLDEYYLEATQEEGVTAQEILAIAKGYLGTYQGDSKHHEIIDTYNAQNNLPNGYRVTYYDSWCDTFVSTIFLKANAVDLIGGTECGVERHVQIFKKKGIWEEDGTITPEPGDIIVYNWDDNTQPNDGFADHIGFVYEVNGNNIVTLEGNASSQVKFCNVKVGSGNIRGYAKPRYDKASTKDLKPIPEISLEEIANEVLDGKWGNGLQRKNALTAAGWDYDEVQRKVNDILNE
jgi:GH25 family lysozyme M1 (1,4-beta-N-acetylmuramidase)